ncbi:MAG: amino acid ABC transporter substrate-binding protein [Desulforhopalus sp.]|jgi:general L-amino acid transport system substrate-binding protein|nr:amino acid ABC transporter substrate-binding protein [Desulforhopalus sp.]
MKHRSCLLLIAFSLLLTASCFASTREEVVSRGHVRCGVSPGSPGFSSVDPAGKWTGLDVDLCRAVAVATLGDADRVEYLPLADNEAFTALLIGEVDLLARQSSWTFSRDADLAVNFAGISYYDGQGFLVSKKLNVKNARELKRVRVCNPVALLFTDNLLDFFERTGVEFRLVPYDTLDLAIKGFASDGCDLLSLPQSQLYGLRHRLADQESALILPEVISREPLGPVVRHGDDAWLDIVSWALLAMINAEELGVTSGNLDEMRRSNSLAIKQFFGLVEIGGRSLGLSTDWAVQIISQVGNYGEVYLRHFGPDSPLKIDRGLNKLWNQGGLHYPPPLR